MTNERKLELTLCGLLPYGLKGIAKDENLGIENVIGIQYFTNGIEVITNIENIVLDGFKPLLHSLDKLTDPILEGGLIPIDELDKIYTGFYFAFTSNQLLVKRKNSNIYFDVNHIGEILEKLKEWHFNIYNLPSEMYIEKSTVNI